MNRFSLKKFQLLVAFFFIIIFIITPFGSALSQMQQTDQSTDPEIKDTTESVSEETLIKKEPEKPDIEPTHIYISGKDRSKLQQQRERKIQRLKEKRLNIHIPKIELKDFLALDAVEFKASKDLTAEKLPQTENSHSILKILHGQYDTTIYQLQHLRNLSKEIDLSLKIERSTSNGFSWKEINHFNQLSKDKIKIKSSFLLERGIFNCTIDYLNKDIFLPYHQTKDKIRNTHFMVSYHLLGHHNFLLSGYYNATDTKMDSAINQRLGLKACFKLPPPNQKFLLGCNIYQNIFNRKDKSIIYHLYASGTRLNIKPFTLDLTASLDYHTLFPPLHFGFYAQLSHPVKEKGTISTNIEWKFKHLPFDDLFTKTDYITVYQKEIKPSYERLFQIKGDYRVSKDVSLSGVFFLKDIENFVCWEPKDKQKPLYQPKNIENVSLQGVNFKLTSNLTKNLKQIFQAEFINAVNKEENLYVPNIPNYSIGSQLNYETKLLKISLHCRFSSSCYAYVDGSEKLPSFLLVNFNIQRSINKDTVLFLTCENLLNQEYQLKKGYPEQPRRVCLGLKLRL